MATAKNSCQSCRQLVTAVKPNLPNQTKSTKPNLPNQTYQTKPNLPNQTDQTKPNLPNQTCLTKPTKTNQTKPTKHTEPNLPNQNCWSKQSTPGSVVPLAMFLSLCFLGNIFLLGVWQATLARFLWPFFVVSKRGGIKNQDSPNIS